MALSNKEKYLKIYKSKVHSIRDMYLKYLEEHCDDAEHMPSFAVFKGILMDYFKYIETEVLDNSREFKFPYRLGSLVIKKRKTNSAYRHFHVYNEDGTTKQSFNEHSNGWKFMFIWNHSPSPVISKYQLFMIRRVKRRLASLINAGAHDYIEK